MKYLLTVLCGILLFTSCKDDNDEPSGALLDKTVIFYMAGDNSLSENMGDNIRDAVAAASEGTGDRNRIVMIVDNYDTKPTQIVINNGKVESLMEFDNEFYLTSPTMMKTLLSSVMNTYKAKSYGLLLWGHSTGWLVESDTIRTRGYGPDNNGGGSSLNSIWINFTTMAEVLKSLPSKFDFMIGDCCLLQCAEVAYELRNCADYIIGAPSETPVFGIPYKEAVPYMFSSSSDSYMKIAEAITDNKVQSDGVNYYVPSSVIKTSAMQNLASATKKVISQGLLPYPVNTTQAIYYFKYSGMKIMYDMQDIFLKNVSAEAYDEWKKAFDAAVVYRKPSSRWITSYDWTKDFTVADDNYGGMSMFFPMEQYDRMSKYLPNERIRNMQWYWDAGIDQYAR